MERSMSKEDNDHLNLLSIFHYVVGGLTGLFSCMPFMHVFMGLALLSGKFGEGSGGSAPPPFMGWMFVITGSVVILFGWLIAASILIAGGRLKRRRSRLFCMIVAGIECMFMPFGTILGVFTLITLNKDSVKELFAEQVATTTPQE
jgi:hypothetical protein